MPGLQAICMENLCVCVCVVGWRELIIAGHPIVMIKNYYLAFSG
jgi:hypothetical protein